MNKTDDNFDEFDYGINKGFYESIDCFIYFFQTNVRIIVMYSKVFNFEKSMKL